MTFAECEKRNEAIENALGAWRWGRTTLSRTDIEYLCCVHKIKPPKALELLEFSESPDQACACVKNPAEWKSIFRLLKKLAEYA